MFNSFLIFASNWGNSKDIRVCCVFVLYLLYRGGKIHEASFNTRGRKEKTKPTSGDMREAIKDSSLLGYINQEASKKFLLLHRSNSGNTTRIEFYLAHRDIYETKSVSRNAFGQVVQERTAWLWDGKTNTILSIHVPEKKILLRCGILWVEHPLKNFSMLQTGLLQMTRPGINLEKGELESLGNSLVRIIQQFPARKGTFQLREI